MAALRMLMLMAAPKSLESNTLGREDEGNEDAKGTVGGAVEGEVGN